MARIIIETEPAGGRQRAVLWEERVRPADLESEHFCGQFIERVGWALSDADEVEHQTRRRR